MQSLIVILGLALVFSPDTLVDGLSLAPGQDWLDDLLFAVPLGFLAYTGLETVANLAEEAREPGARCRARSSRRSGSSSSSPCSSRWSA